MVSSRNINKLRMNRCTVKVIAIKFSRFTLRSPEISFCNFRKYLSHRILNLSMWIASGNLFFSDAPDCLIVALCSLEKESQSQLFAWLNAQKISLARYLEEKKTILFRNKLPLRTFSVFKKLCSLFGRVSMVKTYKRQSQSAKITFFKITNKKFI